MYRLPRGCKCRRITRREIGTDSNGRAVRLGLRSVPTADTHQFTLCMILSLVFAGLALSALVAHWTARHRPVA